MRAGRVCQTVAHPDHRNSLASSCGGGTLHAVDHRRPAQLPLLRSGTEAMIAA